MILVVFPPPTVDSKLFDPTSASPCALPPAGRKGSSRGRASNARDGSSCKPELSPQSLDMGAL